MKKNCIYLLRVKKSQIVEKTHAHVQKTDINDKKAKYMYTYIKDNVRQAIL